MSNELQKYKYFIGSIISTIAITYYFLNYFHHKEINEYKNEIASINKNIVVLNNKQVYDLSKMIIDKSERSTLSLKYESFYKDSVYFNKDFVGNDWIYEVLTVEDYYKKYFDGKIPTYVNKNKFKNKIYHWKNPKKVFLKSALGQVTKYNYYESYIQLEIESKDDVVNLIKSENINIKDTQLLKQVEFYFENYINSEISSNFANLIELNRQSNTNDNTNLIYDDKILYLKNYVTNDKFIVYDEKIVVVLKDVILNIQARIVTTNGITEDSEYFNKWLNNIKFVEH